MAVGGEQRCLERMVGAEHRLGLGTGGADLVADPLSAIGIDRRALNGIGRGLVLRQTARQLIQIAPFPSRLGERSARRLNIDHDHP